MSKQYSFFTPAVDINVVRLCEENEYTSNGDDNPFFLVKIQGKWFAFIRNLFVQYIERQDYSLMNDVLKLDSVFFQLYENTQYNPTGRCFYNPFTHKHVKDEALDWQCVTLKSKSEGGLKTSQLAEKLKLLYVKFEREMDKSVKVKVKRYSLTPAYTPPSNERKQKTSIHDYLSSLPLGSDEYNRVINYLNNRHRQ